MDVTPASEPLEPQGFASLARDSMAYAVGPAAGKAAAIVTLPIITRVLAPAKFGSYDVLSTLVSVAITVLLLGIDTAATRLHAQRDATGQRHLHATWSSIAAAIVVPVALVAVAFRNQISTLLFGNDSLGTAIAFAAIAFAAGTYQYLALTILRVEGRPKTFAALSGGTLLLNAIASIVLVVRYQSVSSIMAGMALSLLVGMVVGLVLVRSSILARPTRDSARALLRLGLPLAPAVALMWIAEFVNRFAVLHFAGDTQAGYFSVAVRVASIAGLVVTAFQTAWHPHAFRVVEHSDSQPRLGNEGLRIIACVCACGTLIAVFAVEIIRIASGTAFASALPTAGATIVTVMLSSVFLMVSLPLLIAKNMRKLGIVTGATSVTAMLASVALAPSLGALGAGVGLVMAQGVGIGLCARQASSDNVPFRFEWRRIALLTLPAAAISVISATDWGAERLLLRVLLGLAYVGVLAIEGSLGAGIRFGTRAITRRLSPSSSVR